MITKITSVLTVSLFVLASCGSDGTKNENEVGEANKDTTQHATNPDEKEIKEVAVTYTNVDAKLVTSLKEVTDHYLHIKNALVNDNAGEAANGGKAMDQALKGIDKSLFTAEQKKAYDSNESELKEHADHIAKNGDNIKHQREHFFMMSKGIYSIVRSFGAGRPLYHDHCPMYNEDKGGAMWLSETKEVKNPYFGSQMLKCGTVEEIIK